VHRLGEQRPDGPALQVGFDSSALRVTGEHHRPVALEGRLCGRLVEVLRRQLSLRLDRPARPSSPDPRVTQQELGQPITRPN